MTRRSKASALLQDVDRLERLLKCEFNTGHLYWKPRTTVDFDSDRYSQGVERAAAIWNTRFAGKRAMCTLRPDGYLVGTLFGSSVLTHRVVWTMYTGEQIPDKHVLDHINGVRTDNRIANLRLVNYAQNSANSMVTGARCGFRGVSVDRASRKWRARIYRAGREHHLGLYETPEEAAKAYREAAKKFDREYSVYVCR